MIRSVDWNAFLLRQPCCICRQLIELIIIHDSIVVVTSLCLVVIEHRAGAILGLRWQQVWAREYFKDSTHTTTGRQPSHRLLGAWAQWRLNDRLTLDLAAENLANETYHLDNGFASQGVEGAGRNLRVAMSARY